MHIQSSPARYGVAILAAAIVTLVAAGFLIGEAGAPIHLGLHLLTGLAIVVLLIEFFSKNRREVALRRSEIELSDFFENAAVPIRWVGPGGIVLRANRAELNLLGYREDEYVGRHISEFHVDPVALNELLRRLSRGETVESYEARLRAKDGSIRHVLISSSVLFENGRFIHTRCITQDITARRQAEEALARAEQLFRSLAMKAPVGIFQTDLQGDCLFVNERWSQITGLSPEEAAGRGWIEALHPEDRERVFAEWYQAAQSGKEFASEYRFRTPQGRVTWVSGAATAVKADGGGAGGYLGTVADITALKVAEEERKLSERLLRLTGDAVPALISYIDAGERYRFNNLAYQDWFGRPRDEVYGKHLREVLGEAAYQKIQPHVRAALRGEKVSFEDVLPYSEGGARFVVVTYVPDLSPQGTVMGFVAFVNDLTERKRLEEDLQTKVSELAVADRRKDLFLAMLGHELRNPLASIGYAVQVQRLVSQQTPQLRQTTDVISRQVQQLAHMVDDLLDVSRITRGKVRLKKERINIAAVVAIASDAVRPLMEERRHTFRLSLPEKPMWVEGDIGRLGQALTNVLNNAAKYTDPGGRIDLTADCSEGGATIRVKDNGRGIPPDLLPNVFDLFAQGIRTLDRSEGGLGIGLTLTRSLLELHGGSIEARSEGPGKGSEFILRLPICGQYPADEPRERTAPPAVRRRRAVLVVEDNRDSAQILAVLLQAGGHQVRVAHDGDAAIGAVKDFTPDLVLLDIGLPGLDGYGVARELRSMPALDRALLVAVTGYGQPEDRRQALEAGFDEHLVKPVTPEALEQVLLLERPAGGQPAAPGRKGS